MLEAFQRKRWIESTFNLIKMSVYYGKVGSTCCSSRPVFAKKGGNPVLNGKEEESESRKGEQKRPKQMVRASKVECPLKFRLLAATNMWTNNKQDKAIENDSTEEAFNLFAVTRENNIRIPSMRFKQIKNVPYKIKDLIKATRVAQMKTNVGC